MVKYSTDGKNGRGEKKLRSDGEGMRTHTNLIMGNKHLQLNRKGGGSTSAESLSSGPQ